MWIAAGVYIPSKVYTAGRKYGVDTPFLKTFNPPDQVSLYGGFSGTERRLSERNFQAQYLMVELLLLFHQID